MKATQELENLSVKESLTQLCTKIDNYVLMKSKP